MELSENQSHYTVQLNLLMVQFKWNLSSETDWIAPSTFMYSVIV